MRQEKLMAHGSQCMPGLWNSVPLHSITASYLPFTYFIVEVTELNAYLSPSVANSRFFRADVGSKCATLVAVNAITDLDARRFRCLVCVPYSVAGFVMRLVQTSVGSRGDAGGAGSAQCRAEAVQLVSFCAYRRCLHAILLCLNARTPSVTTLCCLRVSWTYAHQIAFAVVHSAKTDAFWRCKRKDTQTSLLNIEAQL